MVIRLGGGGGYMYIQCMRVHMYCICIVCAYAYVCILFFPLQLRLHNNAYIFGIFHAENVAKENFQMKFDIA